MAQEKPSIPEIVYEGVSSTLSRWWQRIAQRINGSEESLDDDDIVYTNSYTSLPLKSILKKDSKQAGKEKSQFQEFDEVVDAVLETSRLNVSKREREVAPNRKGPLPTVDLPLSERGEVKLTHASLNPHSFSNEQGVLSSSVLPSNRGLLTYFARVAQSTGKDETIDLMFVQSLLSAGADINIGDKYGQTILHTIVRDWHPDVVKFAISFGSDINRRDRYGRTPLHVAAAANYPLMIEYLVKNGAQLDARTEGEHQTPVHYAAKNNAVESMKCLIKIGGQISDRDYKERTPLFLAAEQGREDMVSYLLELGAGAAVYDSDGNCAVSLMVDKMPQLAYKALNQFLMEDKASRKIRYYLANLEFDATCKLGRTPARSILETIVYNEDHFLVKHPVIQKLIAVKWQKFARLSAYLDIIANVLYACVFTSLAMFRAPNDFYFPLKKWGWRIGMEALFLLMTFYLAFLQLKTARRSKRRHQIWRKWRIRCMSRDLKNCHPQWPEEKRYLKQEIAHVSGLPPTYFRNGWNWYEWISFIGIIAIAVTQTIYLLTKNRTARMGIWITYSVELFLIWLRLLKQFRTLPFTSAFIVMIANIMKGSAQFLFIFLEFFIPLLIAFHVLFGGSENEKIMKAAGIESQLIESYTHFPKLLYTLYSMAFAGVFSTAACQAVDRKMANVLFSISIAILNILCLNLFIALMSYLFQREYADAKARALLQRAECLLQSERNLSAKAEKRIRKYIRRNCGPLEQYQMTSEGTEDTRQLDDVVESVAGSVKAIGLALDHTKNRTKPRTHDSDESKARTIHSNVNDIIASHEEARQVFDEKWGKIQENQRIIAELLAKPEIKEFLEKNKAAHKKGERKKHRSLERQHSATSTSSRSGSTHSRSGSTHSRSGSTRSRPGSTHSRQ